VARAAGNAMAGSKEQSSAVVFEDTAGKEDAWCGRSSNCARNFDEDAAQVDDSLHRMLQREILALGSG
jgi:hypothetical protein